MRTSPLLWGRRLWPSLCLMFEALSPWPKRHCVIRKHLRVLHRDRSTRFPEAQREPPHRSPQNLIWSTWGQLPISGALATDSFPLPVTRRSLQLSSFPAQGLPTRLSLSQDAGVTFLPSVSGLSQTTESERPGISAVSFQKCPLLPLLGFLQLPPTHALDALC